MYILCSKVSVSKGVNVTKGYKSIRTTDRRRLHNPLWVKTLKVVCKVYMKVSTFLPVLSVILLSLRCHLNR